MKGADKYPETFNPDSWESEELAIHILEELRDAQVYAVAMLDRMNKLRQSNKDIHKDQKYFANKVDELEREKSAIQISLNMQTEKLVTAQEEINHLKDLLIKQAHDNVKLVLENSKLKEYISKDIEDVEDKLIQSQENIIRAEQGKKELTEWLQSRFKSRQTLLNHQTTDL